MDSISNGPENYLHAVNSSWAPTGCELIPRLATKDQDIPSEAFPPFMNPNDKRPAAEKSIPHLPRPAVSVLRKSGNATAGLPGIPWDLRAGHALS